MSAVAKTGDAVRLLVRYLALSVRGQMQYRVSFLLGVAGQFLLTGIEFLGVWALFARFENLAGWTLPEVALFYGVANVAFSLADALSAGFDQMGVTVRQGDFDRLLLRPRGTLLQLAGTELSLRRAGRLLQGLVVLLWAAQALGVVWTLGNLGLLAFTIAGGACMFLGLFVLQATLCFFTVESLEIMNTLTYGGVATAQYPLSIYGPGFRRFFTFVVPLACVSYFPVVLLTGRADPLGSPVWFQVLSPSAGFLFLGLAALVWHWGLRRYASTGS